MMEKKKKKTDVLSILSMLRTIELQWLEHLQDHENLFETREVGANEC